jgi:formimidoylglutamase
LRTPGRYNAPRFSDPNDKRLVQIIKPRREAQPRAVNILGVPFDGAVLGRKGAAGGPAAVREALSGFSNYNAELGVGLHQSRIFDLGDVEVDQEEVVWTHAETEREVNDALQKSSLLIIIGGDNSISLPSLRAYGRKFREIGLVAIDSHLDLRGKIRGKPTSGSAYGLALEEVRGLDPRRVVEIGIHGFLNSEDYLRKARKLGIKVIPASEVRRRGPMAVTAEAYARASRGADAVYLSVDLDAVDLAQVSGVSAPSAGGISSEELFELIYFLTSKPKVKCADLVELAPSLDPTGRSQIVAATAITYMLTGSARRGIS